MSLLDLPSLTKTQADGKYVPKWQPNTAYTSGQYVMNPSGQIVSAVAGFTSGSSYSAANWSVVASTNGSFTLSAPGVLSVGSGVARFPIGTACTIKGVTIAMSTVANQDVIIDVNKNGTTLFADANTRPKITAGQLIASRVPLSIAANAGDYITVDRDQVGGLAPASAIASTDNTSGGQTVVFTRPSGAAIGDIQIGAIIVGVGGTAGVNQPATTVTAPTGWTELGSPTRQADNPSSRDLEMHLFWWRDDGSQSTWTFSITQPTVNSYSEGKIVTVRGCVASGTPIDAYATSTSSAGATSAAAPSVTTTAAGDMLLAIFANANPPTAAVVPTGMTFIGSTTVRETITAYQIQSAIGATGTRTLTNAGTSPSSHWMNATIALLANQSNAAYGADLTVVVDYSA